MSAVTLVLMTTNVTIYCQMSPGGQNPPPPLENHSPRLIQSSIKYHSLFLQHFHQSLAFSHSYEKNTIFLQLARRQLILLFKGFASQGYYILLALSMIFVHWQSYILPFTCPFCFLYLPSNLGHEAGRPGGYKAHHCPLTLLRSCT